MNARRFACFFLGAWLATGAAVALIIFLNHQSARTLADPVSPGLAAQVKSVGPGPSNRLFALLTAEQNQLYREYWGAVQIVAGVLFLLFLVFGTREGKGALAVAGAVLLVVILQRTLLVPEIKDLTRLLHSGVGVGSGVRARLFAVQWIYHGVEALKLLAGAVVVTLLVRQGRRGLRHPGQQVDVIDKPDHRRGNW
jgi:hypothetical protein